VTRAPRAGARLVARGALAVALGASLAAASCGYSMGFRARGGITSICVPVFENKSLRREVEFPLTEAVVREIQRRTPLAVLPRERADVTLEGTIESFEQRVLVEGNQDQVLESAAVITVGVRAVDRGGNQVFLYAGGGGDLTSGPALVETAQFADAQGESIAQPTTDAFQNLAERIVMLLEARRGRAASAPEGAR